MKNVFAVLVAHRSGIVSSLWAAQRERRPDLLRLFSSVPAVGAANALADRLRHDLLGHHGS